MHLKRIYFISLKVGFVYIEKYCENHALTKTPIFQILNKKKTQSNHPPIVFINSMQSKIPIGP